MQTTLMDVWIAAMEKMKAGELLELFDDLLKNSSKREHIVTWLPIDYAPATW